MTSDSTPTAPCEMPSSVGRFGNRSLSVEAGPHSEERVLYARRSAEAWRDHILLSTMRWYARQYVPSSRRQVKEERSPIMNRSVVVTGIILALSLTGCTGFFSDRLSSTSPLLRQSAAGEQAVERDSQWRQEAEELRLFADRHEIEAEILLQHRSPDVGLIQQRRALARQLRVAAAQIERQADEADNRPVPEIVR